MCAFFQGVHALAVVEDGGLTVHLLGGTSRADEQRLRNYLATWLSLSAAKGRPVLAKVSEVD